jgi:hypothetical protein
MNKLYSKLFKKQQYKTTNNLPDLIRKLNKNELMNYERIDAEKEKENDPLYLRVNIEKIDYISEYNNELTFRKQIYLKYKYYLSKISNKHRFDKSIHRLDPETREPLYERWNYEDMGFGKSSLIILAILLGYGVGYLYARFRYDVYYRRIMYIYYTTYMLMFEALDYHVTQFNNLLNYYFPIDMTDTEYEFIVYKKIKTYLQKRKMEKKIDLVMNTDKEIFELDKVMKKIN